MNSSFFILVAVTCVVLAIVAFFIIGVLVFHNRKMVQNRLIVQTLELEKAKKTLVNAIEIQESERSRIGADIHDDLGPTLSAIKLKINQLQIDDAFTSNKINQLKSMVDETIKSIRSISHSLYPNTLEKYGLISALNEMANRINGGHIKMVCNIDLSANDLTFYQQINLYRILQEFCNNSIKYSECNEIILDITSSNNFICIIIRDNGLGFDIKKNEKGLGIRNMRMRADVIDFDLDFISTKNKGTQLKMKNKQPTEVKEPIDQ